MNLVQQNKKVKNPNHHYRSSLRQFIHRPLIVASVDDDDARKSFARSMISRIGHDQKHGKLPPAAFHGLSMLDFIGNRRLVQKEIVEIVAAHIFLGSLGQ